MLSFKLQVETPRDRGNDIVKEAIVAFKEGLDKLRDLVESQWLMKAGQELDTTFKDYSDAIKVRKLSNGLELSLKGWLPVALETGCPRFDMKPGLLGNRYSRVIPIHDGPIFRTVSVNSPPNSWWHPGLQARDFYGKMEKDADQLLERSFGLTLDRISV